MFYQVLVHNLVRVRKIVKMKDMHFHLRIIKIQAKILKSQCLKNVVYFVNQKEK
jgi:hypothetical protein